MPSAEDSKTQALPTPPEKKEAKAAKKETKKAAEKEGKEHRKKRRKNDRPSSSALLWFVGSFLLAAVLFSVIAYFLLPLFGVYLPFVSAPQDEQTTGVMESAPQNTVSQPRCISAAIYITDDTDHLQTVSLVMFQPSTMEISVLGLPAQLKVSDMEADTLYHRFESGRATSAHMALMTYLGKSVDYHFTLSYENSDLLLRALRHQLYVNLPVSVDEQTANNDYSIHLPAGEQALTYEQTERILQYNNWQGGISERAQMHATFVSNYLQQLLRSDRNIKDDYNTLRSHVACNLSNEHFNVLLPMLQEFATKNSDVNFVIHYTEGSYEGAGNNLCFTPGSQSIDIVKATLP